MNTTGNTTVDSPSKLKNPISTIPTVPNRRKSVPTINGAQLANPDI